VDPTAGEIFESYRAGNRAVAEERHDALIERLITLFDAGRKDEARRLHDDYVANLCTLVRAGELSAVRYFHDLFVKQVNARRLPEEKPLSRFLDSLYVVQLAARYRAGDEEGATRLDYRYREEMLHLSRRALARSVMGTQISTEGIVQEALRSFFSSIQSSRFDMGKGTLGGLMARIVLCKVWKKLSRKFPPPIALAPEYVAARIDKVQADVDGDLSDPEVAAIHHELIGPLLQRRTRKEQNILLSHLDEEREYSMKEISRRCHCAEKYVEQVIDGFTAELRQLLQSEDDSHSGE
jgi:DNA-directed RNA polymerase specialized sigma24 family protein